MILGLDPGERRIGVAIADPETRFATPVKVIDRREPDWARRIAELVAELGVSKVVVGRPTGLSGLPGPAVEAQQRFLVEVREALDVEVEEHDERLTTVVAEKGLRGGGTRAGRRKELRDAVAAQVMLQGYLDATERSL